MVLALVSYLIGVEEDDPLPYEIKHIYFYLEQNILGFGGTELEKKIMGDFEYYPIESQFFTEQKEYFNKNPMIKLKNLLIDAFEDTRLKEIYKGKTIHIGKLYEEILYSFIVN